MVKWSRTNEKTKLMKALIFCGMGLVQIKNQSNEVSNFGFKGCVQIKKLNSWGP